MSKVKLNGRYRLAGAHLPSKEDRLPILKLVNILGLEWI
jgi:hypothetical protein